MERRNPIAVAVAIGVISFAAATAASAHDNGAQRASTHLTLDRYGAALTYVHGRHRHYRHGHRHYRYGNSRGYRHGYRYHGHGYHGRRYRTYWYYDGYRYRPYRRYYRY